MNVKQNLSNGSANYAPTGRERKLIIPQEFQKTGLATVCLILKPPLDMQKTEHVIILNQTVKIPMDKKIIEAIKLIVDSTDCGECGRVVQEERHGEEDYYQYSNNGEIRREWDDQT